MAYHIRCRETVQAALRRIAMEELRASVNDVRLRQPNSHEAVHDIRKRCKKMRGLLRLVRPHLGEPFKSENAFFRDLSRDLSYVRDAQALLEAMDRLMNRYHHEVRPSDLGAITAVLVESRDSVAGGDEILVAKLESMVAPLEQAIERSSHWEVSASGFEAIEPGLKNTYGRARRAMDRAFRHPSMHHFHDWRKRVKYHSYHSQLLRRICPRLLKPHRRLAESLGELLGQDHDYAVLRERLSDIQGDRELDRQRTILFALIERQQQELRADVSRLGRYVQAETPGQLASRWKVYWEASRDETLV